MRLFSAKSRHPYSKMCVLFVKNNRLVSDLHYRFVGKYANLNTPRIHIYYSYKIVFVKSQCKKCCKRLLLSRCDENKNLLAVNLHILITNELHDFRKEKLMQTSWFRHNYCMILQFLVILHRIFGRAFPPLPYPTHY